jgi:dihydropteroate synthase
VVVVMGILNVTPDSFSDGGRYLEPEAAVARGEQLVAEGADVIDVGAESTRPGARPVSADEELRRLLPALRRLRARVHVPISVDTCKAAVAAAAIDAGADIVNDVTAGTGDPAMLGVVRRAEAPIVLMHMRGTPVTMQDAPAYPGGDVVSAVVGYLRARVAAARAAGIPGDRIIVDPGIGFGKTTAHNLALISGLGAVVALGYPVLVGPSRKRFIGEITGGPATGDVHGTAAAVALAVDRGAAMVRVHDVASAVRAVRVAAAVRAAAVVAIAPGRRDAGCDR